MRSRSAAVIVAAIDRADAAACRWARRLLSQGISDELASAMKTLPASSSLRPRGYRAALVLAAFLSVAAQAQPAAPPASTAASLGKTSGYADTRAIYGTSGRSAAFGPVTDASEVDTATLRARQSALDADNALSRVRLVELPPDYRPGQYTRPRIAVGLRSDPMRRFANAMGLSAQSCLAPMVRARASLSAKGDAGARVMLYARCALN